MPTDILIINLKLNTLVQLPGFSCHVLLSGQGQQILVFTKDKQVGQEERDTRSTGDVGTWWQDRVRDSLDWSQLRR